MTTQTKTATTTIERYKRGERTDTTFYVAFNYENGDCYVQCMACDDEYDFVAPQSLASIVQQHTCEISDSDVPTLTPAEEQPGVKIEWTRYPEITR